MENGERRERDSVCVCVCARGCVRTHVCARVRECVRVGVGMSARQLGRRCVQPRVGAEEW